MFLAEAPFLLCCVELHLDLPMQRPVLLKHLVLVCTAVRFQAHDIMQQVLTLWQQLVTTTYKADERPELHWPWIPGNPL